MKIKRIISLAAAGALADALSLGSFAADAESPLLKIQGNHEVVAGDQLRYNFEHIVNMSDVDLADYYWHISLPPQTELEWFYTGTWTQPLPVVVWYKTNRQTDFQEGLTLPADEGAYLDFSRATLALGSEEYVTDITLEFGTVRPGFQNIAAPTLVALTDGNMADGEPVGITAWAGGRTASGWTASESNWTTEALQLVKAGQPRMKIY